jgi:hypothetical protein
MMNTPRLAEQFLAFALFDTAQLAARSFIVAKGKGPPTTACAPTQPFASRSTGTRESPGPRIQARRLSGKASGCEMNEEKATMVKNRKFLLAILAIVISIPILYIGYIILWTGGLLKATSDTMPIQNTASSFMHA